MKISPLPTSGIAGVELPQAGTSSQPVDQQVQKIQDSIRRIKMRTQRSTTVIPPELEQALTAEATPSTISDNDAQTPVAEDTKPLSPQLVALAKQRRALQVKERELLDKEKALESRSTQDGSQDLIAKLKSEPLRVLQEHGVTYDQLTEAILSDQSGTNPRILELEAKLKALEEGVTKNFSERDSQAETQVLNEMTKEAQSLASQGEAFELIRENRAVPTVVKLIHQTWKQTGEVLDVTEAMQLVEDELLKDNLRIANFGKVKSRLTPAQQPLAQTVQKPNVIRTLTNRDSSNPTLDRKQRAIMAMNGLLKKG